MYGIHEMGITQKGFRKIINQHHQCALPTDDQGPCSLDT